MGLAYWISPKGDVLEPSSYHIGAIINKPKKFGETDQSIKDTFDMHGEPISRNSEGLARNEIMTRVMKRGFIRIRKHNLRRAQGWVIELYGLNKKKASYISNWAKWLIDNKMAGDVFADVTITDLNNFRSIRKNLALITRSVLEATATSIGDKAVYRMSLDVLSRSVETVNMTFGSEYNVLEKWEDWETYRGTVDRINEYIMYYKE